MTRPQQLLQLSLRCLSLTTAHFKQFSKVQQGAPLVGCLIKGAAHEDIVAQGGIAYPGVLGCVGHAACSMLCGSGQVS